MGYSDYEKHWCIDLDGNRVYKEVHRDVVEKRLGRKLLSTEVVHHIDGNKKNNASENLLVFRTFGDHNRYHATGVLVDMGDDTFTSPPVYYHFVCKNCGKDFKSQNKDAIFCCNDCHMDYLRIDIVPTRDKLFYKLKRQSMSDIAKEYGVCISTLKSWIKKYRFHLKAIKKIKFKKPKPQKKYVGYANLPITIVSKKNPNDQIKFKDLYELTNYFKKTFDGCKNDYTIRKNILRVLNGERKSFHGYIIKSKAYQQIGRAHV